MVISIIFVLMCGTLLLQGHSSYGMPQASREVPQNQDRKLSEKILAVLDYYKQKGAVGLPGVFISDPLPVPPQNLSFVLIEWLDLRATVQFKDMQVKGLQGFRFDHLKVDVPALKAEATIDFSTLNISGMYEYPEKFGHAFTIGAFNISVNTSITFGVDRTSGKLSQNVTMAVSAQTVRMNATDFKLLPYAVQLLIEGSGNFVFNTIKPFLEVEIKTTIMEQLNGALGKIYVMPRHNSVLPIDQLIEGITYSIKQGQLDPYITADFNQSLGLGKFMHLEIKRSSVSGFSTIHRYGDIQFELKNGKISCLLEIEANELEAKRDYVLSLFGGRSTVQVTAKVNIPYVKVHAVLSQSLDTRNPPQLEDITAEWGNVDVSLHCPKKQKRLLRFGFGLNDIRKLTGKKLLNKIEEDLKRDLREKLRVINIGMVVRDHANVIDNLYTSLR